MLPSRAAGYNGYVRYIDIISKGIQDLTISFILIHAIKWSVSASSICVCLGDCERDPSPYHSALPNVPCAKTPESRPLTNTTSMEDTGKENETAS